MDQYIIGSRRYQARIDLTLRLVGRSAAWPYFCKLEKGEADYLRIRNTIRSPNPMQARFRSAGTLVLMVPHIVDLGGAAQVKYTSSTCHAILSKVKKATGETQVEDAKQKNEEYQLAVKALSFEGIYVEQSVVGLLHLLFGTYVKDKVIVA